MNLYRVVIVDRNYSNHLFYNVEDRKEIDPNIVPELNQIIPLDHKMFMDDIFEFRPDLPNKINVVRSLVRSSNQMAGVLMLEDNKTFGRTENKKRLLYRCIPDDIHLPVFLVPYDIKVGFSKVQKNKFVTFKFDNWEHQHPYGMLTETIGDVDNLDCFFEYQLYCKSLHVSLTDFTKKATDVLRQKTQDEYIAAIYKNSNFQIEDHRERYVFTIDPENSTDFDDGFHIEHELIDNVQCGWKVTVYIANVFVWLETLGLWNTFSKRVSTIYLPDHRRPMLPTILTDTLCSLQEKQDRFALSMEFCVAMDGTIDRDRIQYKNTLIRVKKNYRYEEPKLVSGTNARYNELFQLSKLMDKTVKDSHDVVAHWMVQMNSYTGMNLLDRKVGIFRSVVFADAYKDIDALYSVDVSEEAGRIIKSWNNTTGKYVVYNETETLVHDLIGVKSFRQTTHTKGSAQPYIHITSPIRRLIDLLNQMCLFREYGLVKTISKQACDFFDNWINDMEYVNATMRSIRKVQTDCNVLYQCVNNPGYLDTVHKGIVFDKMVKTNGLYTYMVYLDKPKLLSRITCQRDLSNYTYYDFKMFLFEDEHSYKKKIRLQLCDV